MATTFQNEGPAFNVKEMGNVNVTTNFYKNNSDPRPSAEDIMFRIEKPEKKFTGRSSDLKELQQILSTNADAIVLCGMGGVGKTQLVRKFIEENKLQYKNFIWIDSKSIESTDKSFRDLSANILRLTTLDANGKEMDSESVIGGVLKMLNKFKTLIVYDNVDSRHSLIDFILALAPPPVGQRPHVLITSRIRYWPAGIQVIQLKVWNRAEAVEYISQMLNGSHNDSADEKKLLAETLHDFPLALRQSTAYINVQRRTLNEFKISKFIDEYTRQTREMLNYDKLGDASTNPYGETTYTTWRITMNAIGRDELDGRLAIRILNIIAYLDADMIQERIFVRLTVKNENIFRRIFRSFLKVGNREIVGGKAVTSAFDLLVKYSMIDRYRGVSIFSVHRLVQEVTKLWLNESNQEESTLRDALQLLSSDTYRYKDAIPVFVSVLKLANAPKKKLVKEFSSLPVKILDGCQYESGSNEFGTKILEPMTNILGPGDRSILKIRCLLASKHAPYTRLLLQREKKSAEQGLEMLLDIYDTQMSHFRESDPYTLQTRYEIARIHLDLGHINKAKQLFTEALTIERRSSGKSHQNVFERMNEILITYSRNDNVYSELQLHQIIFEEQKKLLGEDNSLTLRNMFYIVNCHKYSGSYELAIKWYKELTEIIFKYGGVKYFVELNSLLNIYYFEDSYVALRFRQIFYERQRNSIGENDSDSFTTFVDISQAHIELRNYDLALQLHEHILEEQQIRFSKGDVRILETMCKIAYIHSQLNANESALQLYRNAFKQRMIGDREYDLVTLIKMIDITFTISYLPLPLHEFILEKEKFWLNEYHVDTLDVMREIARFHLKFKYCHLVQRKFHELFRIRKTVVDEYRNKATIFEGYTLFNMQWWENQLEKRMNGESLKRIKIGQHQTDEGNDDDSLEFFAYIFEKQKARLGKEHHDTLETMSKISLIHFQLRNNASALRSYQEVFKKQKACLGKDHQNTLETMCKIAHIYSRLKDNRSALQWYRNAFDRRMTGVLKKDLFILKTINEIAAEQTAEGNKDVALHVYEYIFKKTRIWLGEDHSDTLMAMRKMALIHLQLNKNNSALQLYQKIFEKQEICLGADHRDTLKTMCDIASVHFEMNNNDLAFRSFETIFEKQKKHFGEDDNCTLRTMCMIAHYYARKKDVRLAFQCYQQPVEIIANSDWEFSSHFKFSLLRDEDEDANDKVLDIPKELPSFESIFQFNKNFETVDNLFALHHWNAEWFCPELALQLYKRIFELRKAKYGENSGKALKAMYRIARKYGELRNNIWALEWYQRASENLKVKPNKIWKFIDKMSSEVSLYIGEENYDLALHLYNIIYEKRKSFYGGDNCYTLRTISDIARTYRTLQNNDMALKLYRELFEKRQSILGEFHPDTLETMSQLASLNEDLGNHTDALRLYQKLFHTWTFLRGGKDADTLKAESKIASLLSELGQQDDFEQRNSEFRDHLRDSFKAEFRILSQRDRQ